MLHAKRLAEFTSRQFDGPDLGEDVERRPSGLPKRAWRLPMRYRDELPAGPVPVPVVQVPDEQNVLEAPGNEYYDPLYRTVQNNYGLFREYASGFPTYDPESGAHIEQLCDGRATQEIGRAHV